MASEPEVQLDSRRQKKAATWDNMIEKGVSNAFLIKHIGEEEKSMELRDLIEISQYFYTKYLQQEKDEKASRYEMVCRVLEEAIKHRKDPRWLTFQPQSIEPAIFSYLEVLEYLLGVQNLELRHELSATYYNHLNHKFHGSYLQNFAKEAMSSCYAISTSSRTLMIYLLKKISNFFNNWPPEELFALRPFSQCEDRMAEDRDYMHRLMSVGGTEKMEEFLEEIFVHKGADYYEELHSFLKERPKDIYLRKEEADKYLDVAREMESFLHRKQTGQSHRLGTSTFIAPAKRMRPTIGPPYRRSTPLSPSKRRQVGSPYRSSTPMTPKRRSTSPTKTAQLPTENVLSPTKNVLSPTKSVLSPTKSVLSPSKTAQSPRNLAVSPTKKHARRSL